MDLLRCWVGDFSNLLGDSESRLAAPSCKRFASEFLLCLFSLACNIVIYMWKIVVLLLQLHAVTWSIYTWSQNTMAMNLFWLGKYKSHKSLHIFVFKILPKEKHIYAEKKEIRKRGNKEKRTKLNNV